MDKEKIGQFLTKKEKDALAVLMKGGFSAFTECRIEDVRELDTGRRRPTWSNQGRYDLVLAFKKLSDRVIISEPVEVEKPNKTKESKKPKRGRPPKEK